MRVRVRVSPEYRLPSSIRGPSVVAVTGSSLTRPTPRTAGFIRSSKQTAWAAWASRPSTWAAMNCAAASVCSAIPSLPRPSRASAASMCSSYSWPMPSAQVVMPRWNAWSAFSRLLLALPPDERLDAAGALLARCLMGATESGNA